MRPKKMSKVPGTRNFWRRSTRSHPALWHPSGCDTPGATSLKRARKPKVACNARLGIPGVRDLISDVLDSLTLLTDPAVTPCGFLNDDPDLARDVFLRARDGYRAVCAAVGLPTQLDVFIQARAWLLTVSGLRELQSRMKTLRGRSLKQLRRLEIIAKAHPCAMTSMEVCLFLALRDAMQARGVVAPAEWPRVDCIACQGTNIPDPERKTRWIRHDACENWVCGGCMQTLRANAAPFAPACPACRGLLLGGQEEVWPGYVVVIDRVQRI